MRTARKFLSLLLALALCAGLSAPALAAETTSGFHAGLIIDRETEGVIAVTVQHSDVLVSEVPTLSIPCDFAYATVTHTPSGEAIPCTIADGQVSFPVAAGGEYVITETDAPAVPQPGSGTAAGGTVNAPWVNPYNDVAAADWYYDAVKAVSQAGLMNGTGAGFSPMAPMQRNMLMTMLARLDGVDTSTGATWDAAGMAWSVARGISDGSAPTRSISRQEIVVMLYRYALLRELDCSTRADLSAYPDHGEVAPWATDAVRWAVAHGILTGRTNGLLDPAGTATRAEVATLMARFLDWMA